MFVVHERPDYCGQRVRGPCVIKGSSVESIDPSKMRLGSDTLLAQLHWWGEVGYIKIIGFYVYILPLLV